MSEVKRIANLTFQEMSPAEKSLKVLTNKEVSPQILSKYPKFNMRLEEQ